MDAASSPATLHASAALLGEADCVQQALQRSVGSWQWGGAPSAALADIREAAPALQGLLRPLALRLASLRTSLQQQMQASADSSADTPSSGFEGGVDGSADPTAAQASDGFASACKAVSRALAPLGDGGVSASPAEIATVLAAVDRLAAAVEDAAAAGATAAAAASAQRAARATASQRFAAAAVDLQEALTSAAATAAERAQRRLAACVAAAAAEVRHAAQCAAERYRTLTTALCAVEGRVSSAFSLLSRHGRCTLLYRRDEEGLYGGGVTLECSPTGHGWRLFKELSGGQQAMAALSLLLALQGVHAAPLYILDEVDAALDGDKVCAAAALLQRSVQQGGKPGAAGGGMPPLYLVVAHRAAMYEAADRMVGVYGGRDGTQLVHCSAEPHDMSEHLGQPDSPSKPLDPPSQTAAVPPVEGVRSPAAGSGTVAHRMACERQLQLDDDSSDCSTISVNTARSAAAELAFSSSSDCSSDLPAAHCADSDSSDEGVVLPSQQQRRRRRAGHK